VFPQTVQQVKRWSKIVSGFTLLAIGIVMLVTPGPGWLVIIAGLALLAAEYVWARRLLQRVKAGGTRLRNAVMPSSKRSGPLDAPPDLILGAPPLSTPMDASSSAPSTVRVKD
jgi:drug/metabolite transporter (DMT)-like permease